MKDLILGTFCMTLITPSLALNGKENVITAYAVGEVQEALSGLQEGAVIFVDVDDTLITPASKVFHWSSPYRFLIDELKKNKEKYKNFETILSHWRLQRKVRLVSTEWPLFINSLKKKYAVYALTKMDSGRLGDIPSMERWRYEELVKMRIKFTPTYDGVSESVLVSDPSSSLPATFYKGIFITGSFTKGEVLKAYFKAQHPPRIILIDDRPEYLADAIAECNRQSIPFLGILFKGMDLIPGSPIPKVAELQKRHLFEKAEWLEDDEALIFS